MEQLLDLAAKFVNNTGVNIYLTGKAGTGKTTFLRNLAKTTHKRYAIVAPTGIAALNAKGVTIHSQFLLPLGLFIPVNEPSGEISDYTNVYTQYTLTRKHPLNAARKQVLRDIDLLIIDEVSMLRADVLDAIDHRMRAVKRNYNEPFGGTQLLMIGDLFQLPPIVRDNEWSIMRQYYRSAFFYDAHALQQSGFVYIELEKIFRQDDETFIALLNNLRNNTTTRADIDLLNQHYRNDLKEVDTNGIITLTTHNRIADDMNQNALNALPGKSFYYEASIKDDFPESMFPIDQTLELKEGAQVMFVKNDTQDGAYFNGKLAAVKKLTADNITVRFAETNQEFVLRKEKWENRRYSIDADTKELEEEIIGEFNQFPIKLAWAITVHKSQGLTFDKAIIDVGRAFAPGQVYVALSRLRSLHGLILRTRIDPSVISSDREVQEFSQRKDTQRPLIEMLDLGQRKYLEQIAANTFDFNAILGQIKYQKGSKDGVMQFEDEELRTTLKTIEDKLFAEKENTQKFQNQLLSLLYQNEQERLLDRIKSGSDYYAKLLKELMRMMVKHIATVKHFTRTKAYVQTMEEIDQLIMKKLVEVHNARFIIEKTLKNEPIDLKVNNQRVLEERKAMVFELEAIAAEKAKKSGKKTGKKKAIKGDSLENTLTLIKEGMTIEQIAEKRGMTEGTIESHIAQLIGLEKVDIINFVGEEEVKAISEVLEKIKSVSETVKALNNDYTFGQVRMVQAFLNKGE